MQDSHHRINMMRYTLRQRKQNITYAETNEHERDSHRHDPDHSTMKLPATRNILQSTSGVSGPIPQRKRSRSSNGTMEGERYQTNEVPLSREFPTPIMHSFPATEGQSSGAEIRQSMEISEVGRSPNIEGSPSPRAEKEPTSPEGRSLSVPERIISSGKTILSWLIDRGLVSEDEQVFYKHDTMERSVGTITRVGVLCSCCQEEMSVWKFEMHVGSHLKQPYKNIFLYQKKKSLRDYLITAWNMPDEQKRQEMFSFQSIEAFTNQNDGVCSICGEESELLCCDKCPSKFHQHCMNMKRAPGRHWSCAYCICTYCKRGEETDSLGSLIKCIHCEKQFHYNCSPRVSRGIGSPTLYCSVNCKIIYEKLKSSLEPKITEWENYYWRVIRPMDIFSLPDESKLHENNCKVAVSSTLLTESFERISDTHTGINVIESVAYSRGSLKLTRINFSRFHTFILEKDDAIVCAACIRIHDRKVAEMSFIATEMTCRRQGNCRRLMMQIEKFLDDLKVQNLIIPSALGTTEMWKKSFNFKELTIELKRDLASYKILTFPNAIKLYKDLSSGTAGEVESLTLPPSSSERPLIGPIPSEETSIDPSPSAMPLIDPPPIARPHMDLNMNPNEE